MRQWPVGDRLGHAISTAAGAGGTEQLSASTAVLIQLANTSAPAIASTAAACANLMLDMWSN